MRKNDRFLALANLVVQDEMPWIQLASTFLATTIYGFLIGAITFQVVPSLLAAAVVFSLLAVDAIRSRQHAYDSIARQASFGLANGALVSLMSWPPILEVFLLVAAVWMFGWIFLPKFVYVTFSATAAVSILSLSGYFLVK